MAEVLCKTAEEQGTTWAVEKFAINRDLQQEVLSQIKGYMHKEKPNQQKGKDSNLNYSA